MFLCTTMVNKGDMQADFASSLDLKVTPGKKIDVGETSEGRKRWQGLDLLNIIV